MSKPNSGYIDPDPVIGIFRFSDFLFPVRQRLWVSFGVATLPHLPVMSLWKKLMDIQKPLAGVTRCASWHVDFQIFRWPFLEGRWGEHKKERPPPILHIKRSDILPREIGSLGVWFLKSVMFYQFSVRWYWSPSSSKYIFIVCFKHHCQSNLL